MLELRLAHKNDLLAEAAALQEDLHKTIEDLQERLRALKTDLKKEQEASGLLRTQLEEATRALASKDQELSQALLESSVKVDREAEFFDEIDKLKEKLAGLARQEHAHKAQNQDLLQLVEQQRQELAGLRSGPHSKTYEHLRTSFETPRAPVETSEESALVVLSKLKKLLRARDVSAVFLKVSHYYIEHAKDKSNRKLLDKLVGLVRDLNPQYTARPTNAQLWNALVRLVDEHASLKRAAEGKLVQKLEKLFRVPASQLYSTAAKLLNSSKPR